MYVRMMHFAHIEYLCEKENYTLAKALMFYEETLSSLRVVILQCESAPRTQAYIMVLVTAKSHVCLRVCREEFCCLSHCFSGRYIHCVQGPTVSERVIPQVFTGQAKAWLCSIGVNINYSRPHLH